LLGIFLFMAFIKSLKNRVWTLPPDIRDLIPSDHICYLVESFVDEMDFSEFEIRYDGSGHPAYHPCIICKILIQSMLDRVRSSRSIARNVRENVVYRLSQNHFDFYNWVVLISIFLLFWQEFINYHRST